MMFPLDHIPFDAYCRLLSSHKAYLSEFVPSTMEYDLTSGRGNALVFWYPDLSLKLYDLADRGVHYKDYLDSLNESNYWLFIDLFQETTKKLDSLLDRKFNNNHLSEIKIKNGKITGGKK